MNFDPKKQLEGMKETANQHMKEISRWDKPVSGFSEAQQLSLGNLCVEFEFLLERFNTAIESLEDYQ